LLKEALHLTDPPTYLEAKVKCRRTPDNIVVIGFTEHSKTIAFPVGVS